MCALTVWLAFRLRLDHWSMFIGPQWWTVVLACCLVVPIYWRWGLFSTIVRFSGWVSLFSIIKAVAVYGPIYAFVFTVIGVDKVPRSIGVLQPMLLILGTGSLRVIGRQLLSDNSRRGPYADISKVLIYGAGSAGRQLAAAMTNSREVEVVGYIDDDVALQNSTLNGKPIFAFEKFASVAAKLRVTDVLLAIPSASRSRRQEIINKLQPYTVRVRTLPGLADLARGKIAISDLRELDIEDLLGRPPVQPDHLLLSAQITGQTTLVTGAGGSIGSELCRQIIKSEPETLILVELSEFALYSIHQELTRVIKAEGRTVVVIPLIASVQNHERLRNIMAAWRPSTVYHAAAYKHVPLVEHNSAEGVINNVFGTRTAALAAREAGVKNFVLVSTDKAVRPTNVMGASKRLAEMVLQSMAAEQGSTRFSIVRFGNVLGSSGSAVPLFRHQIKTGGPITVTHLDVTRYFMSVTEAAQLVIHAGAMARGGEVFVLDMGEPIKIADLARTMVELSGLTVKDSANPEGDIEVEITGLRPGEKLYEELLIGDNPELTSHPRIMKAHEDFLPSRILAAWLEKLNYAANTNNVPEMVGIMREVVAGFEPPKAIVDLLYCHQDDATAPDTDKPKRSSGSLTGR
jgi:FlaA1/EpsC-like NDP-sugar epimerase